MDAVLGPIGCRAGSGPHSAPVPSRTAGAFESFSLTRRAALWATGISRVYPTQLLRDQLDQRGITPAARLSTLDDKTRVTVAGIVTYRQRPGSAGGVTFLNLEDETGLVNVICPVPVWTRHRRAARDSPALIIRGMLERAHNLTNVLAEHIQRLPLTMRATGRDFR